MGKGRRGRRGIEEVRERKGTGIEGRNLKRRGIAEVEGEKRNRRME